MSVLVYAKNALLLERVRIPEALGMNIRVKTGNAEVGNSSIKIGKYTGKVKSQDRRHADHLFSRSGPG